MANFEIKDEDIPQFVRHCWEQYQSATEQERKEEEESLGFWVGGKKQWRPGEIESRIANNRPWISINRCKPAVDQVENEARNNPAGPDSYPIGNSGADSDGADINDGLTREYEYRSDAHGAYMIAMRYACAGGRGVYEMGTEYASDRSFEQQIVIKSAEDPSLFFYDPKARKPAREDMMWGGKIRRLDRFQLIEQYGDKLKVLNRSAISQLSGRVGGWMESAFGWRGNQSTANIWTGGGQSQGPYYVCEFYRVIITTDKLKLYSDNILRFEDEAKNLPSGVEVIHDEDKVERTVPRRKVIKYVVTALDVIEKTQWYGTIVPHYWITAPEVWIDGKLYRVSLIQNAIGAQRGLNYTATKALELVGGQGTTPIIGPEGTFDVTNAQGFNPWLASNTQTFAYMEYLPKFATDEAGGQHLLPPPTRNTWEAPIVRILELAQFFGEQIKAATAVFFEPSMLSAKDAQSGEAIKALQQQSNIGTANWQEQLHYAQALSYRQAQLIFKQIYSSRRVRTIVKPDMKHEVVEINREFPEETHERVGNNFKHRKTGQIEKANNITRGEFGVRVQAGPSYKDRTDKSIKTIVEMFKVLPQLANSPVVVAQLLRMVGEGNPEVEQMADSLAPQGDQGATPEQLGQQLQAAKIQNQQMSQALQALQSALAAKIPEIEAGERKNIRDNATRIRAAEITASKDADNAKADRLADTLEQMLALAHDAGMQAQQQEHERGMQAQQQQAAAQSQQNQQDHEAQQNQLASANEETGEE